MGIVTDISLPEVTSGLQMQNINLTGDFHCTFSGCARPNVIQEFLFDDTLCSGLLGEFFTACVTAVLCKEEMEATSKGASLMFLVLEFCLLRRVSYFQDYLSLCAYAQSLSLSLCCLCLDPLICHASPLHYCSGTPKTP